MSRQTLSMAIIDRALADLNYTEHDPKCKGRKGQIVGEAKAWLFGIPDNDLSMICHIAGVSKQGVREKAQRALDHPELIKRHNRPMCTKWSRRPKGVEVKCQN